VGYPGVGVLIARLAARVVSLSTHTTQTPGASTTRPKRSLLSSGIAAAVSLSTQVLQEFYAVVTRKFKPAMPLQKARAVVAAYGEWCAVATQPQLIVCASRLEQEHTLSFWDALVVQAAIWAGAERLVSEDLQDGRRFGVLTIENPFRAT
jgi:predicted nucleic acid-binding protein